MSFKYINLTSKLVIFLFTIVILSCTKEDNKLSNTYSNFDLNLYDKDYIETASIAEKLRYKEFHLSSLMEAVLEINPEFEYLEEFKTAKEEQPTFYLEKLLTSSYKDKNVSLENDKTGKTSSLGAFTDLEGDTWYPVLKRIKKGTGKPKDAVYLMNSYNQKTENEHVKAFILNNDELELLEENYTEDMFLSQSKTNRVSSSFYSLSLSICPDEDGPILKVSNCGGGGGVPSSYDLSTINIKDKKESWIEKADIHQLTQFWDFIESGVYYKSTLNPKGSLIRKVKENELNKNLTVDKFVAGRSAQGIVQYLIFEHDNFPAPPQASVIQGPSGSTFEMRYRSWNKDYDHQLLNVNQSNSGIPSISNYSESKNEIYYKIQ